MVASRAVRGRMLSGAAAGAALLALAVPSPARATATVGTDVEAWYVVRPACPATAVECPDPPASTASTVPSNTLRVGVKGGMETARTYFTLDLDAVPDPAAISGGMLRLPVADVDAGSVAPEAALLRACIVNEAFEPADGSAATPPTFSCGVSADGTFTPAEADRAAAFTFDLARFATRLQDGRSGIAIVPALAALQPPTSWHVAFNGKKREGDAVEPITAELTFAAGATSVPGPSLPIAASHSPGFTFDRSALPDVLPPGPPSAPRATGEVLSQIAGQDVVTSPSVPAGFEQPAVFALPLVLLAASCYFGWALTQPVRIEAA